MTTIPIDTSAIPVLDDDPFSWDILENPVPFQARLREAPVSYLSKYDVYAVGRFDEVRAALANWQQLISGKGVGLDKPWRTLGLLETDPPAHDAPREVIAATMSVRALEGMKDRCREVAESVLDKLFADAPSGAVIEIDGHRDIGHAFPLAFFPEAAGLQSDNREDLIAYADHVFNCGGPRNDIRIAGEARAEELGEWAMAQCQRDAVLPNSFGSEIWAAADRGEVLADRAALLTRSLISAGLDTTVFSISGMMYAFATHPEAWEKVRDNPGLVRLAFEELVRWESPTKGDFRRTDGDVTIGDVTIPDGSQVYVSLGAANRDPRRWENPDEFDLDRDPSGHLGFGMGVHHCVGQHVARMEAATLFEAFIPRVRSIELAGPTVRHHNNTLRGWASVPLRLTLA